MFVRGKIQLGSVLPALVAIVLGGMGSRTAAQPVDAGREVSADRPNLILIYTDDLGFGDVSCYGATQVQTPNVDRIAQQGLRFSNGRCTAATCTPSRFSILTGQYAWRKKGTGILPGDEALIIPTNRTTLGKVFQRAGYRTAAVGKWHLGLGPAGGPDWNKPIKPGPAEVGFDESFIFPATADRVPTVFVRNGTVVAFDPNDPIETNYKQKVGSDPTGKENPELLKMTTTRGHDGTIVNGVGRIGWMTGGRRARWNDEALGLVFVDEAINFIERNKSRPFFLYYAMHDIHVPRVPDTRYKGKSAMGPRGDMILEMDALVGKVLAKLDEERLTSNTIIIFSSDNGPVLDDGYIDGAVAKLNGHKPAGPMRGGKYSILEGGTRVPFLVSWPGVIKPGVSDALVSQVDLVRSFATMTGQKLNPKDAPDSENVLDALLGKSERGRDSVVVAARNRALVKGDWKYIEPQNGPAIMKGADVATGYSPEPQLYNLKDDIAEEHNLASQMPEKLKELQAELQAIEAKGGVWK